jgi:hypothetical protein
MKTSRKHSTVERTTRTAPQADDVAPETATATTGASPKKRAATARKGATKAAVKPAAPKAAKEAIAARDGSKKEQVVAMLQRKDGAGLAEIMKKMGWQRHTVRGFMAGAMKKAGFAVESFKSEQGERVYRITK